MNKERNRDETFADAVRAAWRSPEVPPELERRILQSAAAAAGKNRRRRLEPGRGWWRTAAAALVLMAALAGVWVRYHTPSGVGAVALAEMASEPVIGTADYDWSQFDAKLWELEAEVVLAGAANRQGEFTNLSRFE